MIQCIKNYIDNYLVYRAYIKMMNAPKNISEMELLDMCRNGQNIQDI